MAGLCKPTAARMLVKAIKEETGLPIHFHTHDTSGAAAASVLAAAEAGADAVDGAIDAMSGLTSQPNLGAIVAALQHGPRDTGLDPAVLRKLSTYWEQVRTLYTAFEADFRAGASEVYLHEIPGGQYTNLRQQARSMGLDHHWPEIANTYAAVNQMFGDVIKVTPTSKVVGDLALMMITGRLTPDEVMDPEREIAFPESVVSFFRGDVGQPYGGFPKALQKKVLKGAKPLTKRPGAVMKAVDLKAAKAEAEHKAGRHLSEADFSSYLMYPQVFLDYNQHRRHFGDVSKVPTRAFFYGMDTGEEIAVELEKGRIIIVRLLALGDAGDDGMRTIFFELNGQPRSVRVQDKAAGVTKPKNRVADAADPGHVGAPMPGIVSRIAVKAGQKVKKGDSLMAVEAMKMETAVTAERAGTVRDIIVSIGTQVNAKDLLVVLDQ